MLALLAAADVIVATPDSVSMVSEAVAAAGVRQVAAMASATTVPRPAAPVLLFGAEHLLVGAARGGTWWEGSGGGGGGKLGRFHRGLLGSGATELLPPGSAVAAAAVIARRAEEAAAGAGAAGGAGRVGAEAAAGGGAAALRGDLEGGDTAEVAGVLARELAGIWDDWDA